MSLKKIILIFSILFGIALNAQDIEIKYLNRVCSLGEGQCSKIYIPIDNEKEFIKLLKEYFDSKGAAFVKKEKNVVKSSTIYRDRIDEIIWIKNNNKPKEKISNNFFKEI